jgi:hypothetical protein
MEPFVFRANQSIEPTTTKTEIQVKKRTRGRKKVTRSIDDRKDIKYKEKDKEKEKEREKTQLVPRLYVKNTALESEEGDSRNMKKN